MARSYSTRASTHGKCPAPTQFTQTALSLRTSGRPVRRLAAAGTSAIALASAAALLVACGGGGGGASASEPTASAPPPPPPAVGATAPELDLGAESFWFAPNARSAEPRALDSVAGGERLQANWNPVGDDQLYAAGMKVLFFGQAEGCSQNAAKGPVEAPSDGRMGEIAALTRMSAAQAMSALRWAPSAQTSACSDRARSQSDASAVYVNASDADGAVALLTTSGPQDGGQRSFLGPYGAGGVDGKGTNAHITGTFVTFRQDEAATDPLQPWAGGAKARLQSEQTLGKASVDSAEASVVQVKQQIMVTFYNADCRRELPTAACQMQYVLDTAIVRKGVTDWATQPWFDAAQVWFDPAQGSIPILSGPIKAAGQSTLAQGSSLPLWTSQGSPSRHGAFTQDTFDVTISFAELQNAMRMVTAKALGVAPSAVSEAQIAARWGSAWKTEAAWSLLTLDVGQEVYNPDSNYRAEIGGGFRSLYAGPQK